MRGADAVDEQRRDVHRAPRALRHALDGLVVVLAREELARVARAAEERVSSVLASVSSRDGGAAPSSRPKRLAGVGAICAMPTAHERVFARTASARSVGASAESSRACRPSASTALAAPASAATRSVTSARRTLSTTSAHAGAARRSVEQRRPRC